MAMMMVNRIVMLGGEDYRELQDGKEEQQAEQMRSLSLMSTTILRQRKVCRWTFAMSMDTLRGSRSEFAAVER